MDPSHLIIKLLFENDAYEISEMKILDKIDIFIRLISFVIIIIDRKPKKNFDIRF